MSQYTYIIREDLAYHFHADTGVKAGHALGRDREQNPTTEGEGGSESND